MSRADVAAIYAERNARRIRSERVACLLCAALALSIGAALGAGYLFQYGA